MKAKPHSCVFYCVFEAVAQWLVSHFCCIVGNWVMGESSDSVSIDIEMIPLGGKVRNLGWYQHTQQKTIHFFFFEFFFFFECSLCVCIVVWVCGSFCLWVCSLVDGILQECVVKTSKGSISVFVCGDQEKPALITYPDVALNCMPHFLFMFCKLVLICLFLEIVLVGSCGLIHNVDNGCIFLFLFLLFFLLNFRKMLIYVWLKMVLMGFVLQFHYVENECFFVYLVVLFSKIYDSQCFLLDFLFIGLFSFSPRIWKGTVGVFCFQKLMC